MKDATSEILTAFATALASITYSTFTWPVYTERPTQGKRNYIYLSDVSLNDNSDKDHYIFQGNILIQISAINDKYSRTIVNSLSNSVLQALINQKLSMTSHTMIIGSIAQNVELTEEISTNDRYIKRLVLNFETQQK